MPKKTYNYQPGDTARARNDVITEICEMRHLYDLSCRGCQYHGYLECPEAPEKSETARHQIRVSRSREISREHKRHVLDKEIHEGKVRRVNPEYVNTFDGIRGNLDGKPI
jgi:hypothetical protein